MVVHDLNHATRYAGHMVAIKQGKVVSEGTPEEVMTQEVLRAVFGIEADIVPDPRTGLPLCLPYELAGATDGEEAVKKPVQAGGKPAKPDSSAAAG